MHTRCTTLIAFLVDLLDELGSRVVCGDRAIETLLLDRGLPVRNVKRHAGTGFSSLDSSFHGRKSAWSVDRKSRHERR